MRLSHPFVTYIKSINQETCEKIISLGLSKIKERVKSDISTDGITLGNVQKKNDELRYNYIADKTLEEVQKKEGSADKFYYRDSEVCGLNDKWLYDLFLPLISDANKRTGWNWKIDTAEVFQFAIYHGKKKNGGFYGWHFDGSSDFKSVLKPAIKISNVPPRFKPPKKNSEGTIFINEKRQPEPDMNSDDLPLTKEGSKLSAEYTLDFKKWNKVRKISMTVNLSDPNNYEGGDLKFDLGPHIKERYKICDEIKPQGSVIVFPSFTYHCVTPVTSGTRYSLVLWCLGKPWQ